MTIAVDLGRKATKKKNKKKTKKKTLTISFELGSLNYYLYSLLQNGVVMGVLTLSFDLIKTGAVDTSKSMDVFMQKSKTLLLYFITYSKPVSY